jgi:stage II sporulation protein M
MTDRAVLPYLLILGALFAAAFLGGNAAPEPVSRQVTDALQAVGDQYREMAGGTLFFYILVHNVMASLLLLASGLLYGIVPVLAVGANGFVLGVLFREVAGTLGIAKAAMQVVPHGVFEIPALLFTASYGLWLGILAVRRARGREETPLRVQVNRAFERYFAVVFPLLVMAAAIETYLILRPQ